MARSSEIMERASLAVKKHFSAQESAALKVSRWDYEGHWFTCSAGGEGGFNGSGE